MRGVGHSYLLLTPKILLLACTVQVSCIILGVFHFASTQNENKMLTEELKLDSDSTNSDGEDEWYAKMEEAAQLQSDAFQEQENLENVHMNSSGVQKAVSEEEYYDEMIKTATIHSNATIQPEDSSVWYSVAAKCAVNESNNVEKLQQLSCNDTAGLLIIKQFLFSHLPKSNNMFVIITKLISRADCTEVIELVFVDDCLQPMQVAVCFVATAAKRLEVAYFSPLRAADINFAPLVRSIQSLAHHFSVQDVMLSSFEHALYEELLAKELPRNDIAEVWRDVCEMHACVDTSAPHSRLALPVGYTFSPLRLDDAALVNDTWKYRTKDSLGMVQAMIQHNQTVGVRYTAVGGSGGEGELVAWCLTYRYGAMGMLYTLPGHRRKNLAQLAVCELMRSAADSSSGLPQWPPFVYIEVGNDASMCLFRRLGFSKQADVLWVGLRVATSG